MRNLESLPPQAISDNGRASLKVSYGVHERQRRLLSHDASAVEDRLVDDHRPICPDAETIRAHEQRLAKMGR